MLKGNFWLPYTFLEERGVLCADVESADLLIADGVNALDLVSISRPLKGAIPLSGFCLPRIKSLRGGGRDS